MNKAGKTDLIQVLIVIALLFIGYQYITATKNVETSKDLAPSDLATTINLKITDALATSTTNVDTDYFVFLKSGEYYDSGQTGSDGEDSFDVGYGEDYKLIAYNDSSGSGWLPVETDFTAKGSKMSISMEMVKLGGLEISSVRDPIDWDGNITCGIGVTEGWEVLYKSNLSNAGVLNPVLRIDGNQTGIDAKGISVSTDGWSEADCPQRLSVSSGRKFWCFRKEGVLKASEGVQTVRGTIKFDDTNSPGCTAKTLLKFKMLDEMEYREPDYVSEGFKAFKVGMEDASDSDVGSADSVEKVLGFGA